MLRNVRKRGLRSLESISCISERARFSLMSQSIRRTGRLFCKQRTGKMSLPDAMRHPSESLHEKRRKIRNSSVPWFSLVKKNGQPTPGHNLISLRTDANRKNLPGSESSKSIRCTWKSKHVSLCCCGRTRPCVGWIILPERRVRSCFSELTPARKNDGQSATGGGSHT